MLLARIYEVFSLRCLRCGEPMRPIAVTDSGSITRILAYLGEPTKAPHVAPAPWNSWAKFTLDSDASADYEEMSFYFVWDNPSDSYAVINVDTAFLVSGYFQTGSAGGFFPGDRRSALTVTARLNLLEWWNQPPTSPIGQADQEQQVLHLRTSTGGFNDPGAIEYEDVYNWYTLRYNLFLIPPHGVVVFDVTLAASYSLSNGSIHLDLASGDFQARCPSVVITTLT